LRAPDNRPPLATSTAIQSIRSLTRADAGEEIQSRWQVGAVRLDDHSRIWLFGTWGATDPGLYEALAGSDIGKSATSFVAVA
jgi:hypothetical protein